MSPQIHVAMSSWIPKKLFSALLDRVVQLLNCRIVQNTRKGRRSGFTPSKIYQLAPEND